MERNYIRERYISAQMYSLIKDNTRASPPVAFKLEYLRLTFTKAT